MGPSKEFVLGSERGDGRGLVHLGVLAAAEENDLQAVAIVGTSIGSLFGAMYALNCRILAVINRVKTVSTSEAFAHLELPHSTAADTDDYTWLGKPTAAARETVVYARAARGSFLTDSTVLLESMDHLCGEGSSPTCRSAYTLPVFVFLVVESRSFPRAIRRNSSLPAWRYRVYLNRLLSMGKSLLTANWLLNFRPGKRK
jgi:hypothetical protein